MSGAENQDENHGTQNREPDCDSEEVKGSIKVGHGVVRLGLR